MLIVINIFLDFPPNASLIYFQVKADSNINGF